MRLKRFRVTNFRSVEDSGWVETDSVTALIGTNESGKTNILLPLWKLNPAREGDVIPTADYPRKRYNEFRHKKPKPVFIQAMFDVGSELAQDLAVKTGTPADQIREVAVSRSFDGEYDVDFPDATPLRSVGKEEVVTLLSGAESNIDSMSPLKTEEELKRLLISSIQTARDAIAAPQMEAIHLDSALTTLQSVKLDGAPKTSTIVPRYQQVCDELRVLRENLSRPHPRDVDAAVDLVVAHLPKFVYYSTYGNLDSEIYLPHVISNLERKDLGQKEQAKARTLRVLFEFVKLQPAEILELGRDFRVPNREPTEQEIAAIAEKKKQRSILLQSASSLLTSQFRGWWKQGEYRFRFEADGDHFRIWVADDKRPEEIELEGRSTGLQWFLSFYLVFLVERADAHEDAILLLDEPGLSLHPLAQRDLSAFFDALATDNQLVYTCHSPFLVDADRLDRARKVYVALDGTSKVTADLRASDGDAGQRGAAYAVHAALGLSVAESLLLGCKAVIVEGPADQHYLTTIKNLLTSAGRLKVGRELVFPPAGGAKGVKAVASIVCGKDEALPVALFDGDQQGLAMAKALREGLYARDPALVLTVDTYTGMPNSEVEDLLPPSVIARQLDRWQRSVDVPFADELETGRPIVPQIEAWAVRHGASLEVPGWKVELARRVKRQMLEDGPSAIDPIIIDRWTQLFAAFLRA
jgi:ABC-type cobalamin/Fe3+-siderophores transport system ATPase subunit